MDHNVPSPVEWGDFVPIIVAVTAVQIALVSVSKLCALSDLYKIKRFGHYSEASSTIAYTGAAALALYMWSSGQPTLPLAADERPEAVVNWLEVMLGGYLFLLSAMAVLLLPLGAFRASALTFAFFWVIIGVIAALAFGALDVGTTLPSVAQGAWQCAFLGAWVGYMLVWLVRHPRIRMSQSPAGARMLKTVRDWLDQCPAPQNPRDVETRSAAMHGEAAHSLARSGSGTRSATSGLASTPGPAHSQQHWRRQGRVVFLLSGRRL